jgi:hypothetical protein
MNDLNNCNVASKKGGDAEEVKSVTASETKAPEPATQQPPPVDQNMGG